MMRKCALLAAACALPLLGGCAAFSNVEVPDQNIAVDMPAAFEYLRAQDGARPVDPAWWAAFGSNELNTLMAQAMVANNDILAGVENVEMSRQALRQSGAVFLPQVTANQSTNFTEDRGGIIIDPNTNQPIQGGGGGFNQSDSGRISASYEIDLFGQDRATLRNARASLAQAIYNQRNVELTVQASVANAYFNVISLQQRLESARTSLESVERVADLVQRQYDAGAVSGRDLSAQRTQVANAQATIPGLEQQLAVQENALAILLNQFPEQFDAPVAEIGAILPPPVDVGLPTDLLRRRPDLMAAEAGLAGADANVDAARAAFFPSLTLNAGTSISDLFGAASFTESFGESLSATIFSGGRLESALRRSQAQERQLIINYREAVLNALSDVEDALVQLRTTEEIERLRVIAAEEAQLSFSLSEARYEAGAEDLQAVLDAQRSLLTANDNLVTARQNRLNAAVSLFSALGGGWQGDPEAVRLVEERPTPFLTFLDDN